MTTRIFLLRHAESAIPNVFHGAESDVDLSPRGERQAEAVAQALAAFGPVRVVSSAMRRAVRTAEATARVCGIPHEQEPSLHERRVGVLSGKPFDYEGLWEETRRRWNAGETSYAHAGAESFDAIRDRVLPAWRRIAERRETVAVVAHGVVVKVLIATLFPEMRWDAIGAIPNVSVTELAHDGARWSLARLAWLAPGTAE